MRWMIRSEGDSGRCASDLRASRFAHQDSMPETEYGDPEPTAKAYDQVLCRRVSLPDLGGRSSTCTTPYCSMDSQ